MVILFKIWPKIGPIGIWMGYFFLKNWYLYGSTYKFHGGTTLPKPNSSTPWDLDMEIDEEVVTRYFPKNIINHKFVQYILQTGMVWKLETYVKIVISHFSKPKPGKILIFVFFFFFFATFETFEFRN